jgi:curved DNA-binding protein CbpA
MTVNYYEVLEIPSDADDREIKKAYHKLARELHPDKAPSPEEARKVEDQFALVSAAYNTLKDPGKRADYNKGLAKNNGGAGGAATATARVLNSGRGRPAAAGATTQGSGKQPNGPGITPERVSIAQKAFARGMQFFKEDNLAKAISFFEAAIQNNDQEAIYHARLALALIKEKRSATRAIEAAQRAIDLDPYNQDHKFILAGIYETIGSASNAERVYEDIMRWEQENPRAKAALNDLRRKGRKGLRLPHFATMNGISGLLQNLSARFRR